MANILDIIIKLRKSGTGAADAKNDLEGVQKSAKTAADRLDKIGDGLGGVTNRMRNAGQGAGGALGDLASRIDAAHAKAAGLATGYGELGAAMGGVNSISGVLAQGGLAMTGAGLAAVAVGAVTAGWNLGAYALQADAISKHGKNAKTSLNDLASAFADLKLAAGRHLAPAVDTAARGMATLVESAAGNRQRVLELQQEQIQKNLSQIDIGGVYSGGGMGGAVVSGAQQADTLRAQLAAVDAELAKMRADALQLANANRTLPDTMDAQSNSLRRLAEAFGKTAGVVSAFKWELSGVSAAADVGTAGVFRTIDALDQARAAASVKANANVPDWAERRTIINDTETTVRQDTITKEKEKQARAAEEADRKVKTALERMANKIASTFDDMASRIGRVLDGISGNLKSLVPNMPGLDVNAPGAGGAGEGLYRIADVAQWKTRGAGADTEKFAAQYFPGMGKEQASAAATGITQKAARGDWLAPEVFGAIDWAKLGQQATESAQLDKNKDYAGKAAAAVMASGKELSPENIKAAIDKLAAQDKGIVPSLTDIKSAVDTLGNGSNLADVVKAIEALKAPATTTTTTTKGKEPAKYALGGLSVGGVALVGELGPELVNLPMGSRVYSNSESRRMVAGDLRGAFDTATADGMAAVREQITQLARAAAGDIAARGALMALGAMAN